MVEMKEKPLVDPVRQQRAEIREMKKLFQRVEAEVRAVPVAGGEQGSRTHLLSAIGTAMSVQQDSLKNPQVAETVREAVALLRPENQGADVDPVHQAIRKSKIYTAYKASLGEDVHIVSEGLKSLAEQARVAQQVQELARVPQR